MNATAPILVASRTDTGRVRSHNEDAIGNDPQLGVVVLADGMGGYSSGEVASQIAVNTILEELQRVLPGLSHGDLDPELGYTRQTMAVREAILRANHRIYQAAQQDTRHQGMGTTLVMAAFHGNQVTVAHVGDSRLYRMRDRRLEQLTTDHTLIQELVDHGYYNREEARTAQNKNLVTRALGIEPSVAVDVLEGLALPGDVYLLCSDGLNDMIDDSTIERTLLEAAPDIEAAAERLVERALNAGGRDNISVVLTRVLDTHPKDLPWYKRIIKRLKRS